MVPIPSLNCEVCSEGLTQFLETLKNLSRHGGVGDRNDWHRNVQRFRIMHFLLDFNNLGMY